MYHRDGGAENCGCDTVEGVYRAYLGFNWRAIDDSLSHSLVVYDIVVELICDKEELSYPEEAYGDDNHPLVYLGDVAEGDEGYTEAYDGSNEAAVELEIILRSCGGETSVVFLGISLALKVAVYLVCESEYLHYPEEAYGNEDEPVVSGGEGIKGNDGHTEDDGSCSDTAAYDDGGDEPGELHLGNAGNHNERIVGEDGEEHHEREVYRTSRTKEIKRLFAILLAEDLFTNLVSAESTDSIEHGARNDNAGVGEQERHPGVGIEDRTEHYERRRYTGDYAQQHTEQSLREYEDDEAVPLALEGVEYMLVKYEAVVVVEYSGEHEHAEREQ